MKPLTWNAVHALLNGNTPPCISLYLPTHRRPSENYQDRVAFRNLLKDVEGTLREKHPGREVGPLLAPFAALAEESPFWQQPLDGLAVLSCAARFDVFKLQRPVRQFAVVGDAFYVKPLVRYVQSADRFQVLALTRDRVRLYQGNRYGLDLIALGDDFPATLIAALGETVNEASPTVTARSSGKFGPAVYHGQDSRKDEIDTERFFRVVDREVLARYSRPSRMPLLLVGLAEHQPVFRQVSQNQYLLPQGVTVNPEALSQEELRKEVWKVVEPQYHARLGRLCDEFRAAQAHQKGSADVSDVGRAVVAGRVGTLLVEDDRVVPGRLDVATGAIRPAEPRNHEGGDLLDDVAEEVLRRGGEVVVVPAERMPTKSGLAATYRF
jgi:hypothetical protein